MSVIGGAVNKDFYTEDKATGWYSVNLGRIKNRNQAQVVETQLISDARVERLKAASILVIAVGSGALITAVALIAFKVASLFSGIFVFLLMTPLYELITFTAGLAVGGAVGYIALKKFAQGFLDDSKKHWQYAD